MLPTKSAILFTSCRHNFHIVVRILFGDISAVKGGAYVCDGDVSVRTFLTERDLGTCPLLGAAATYIFRSTETDHWTVSTVEWWDGYVLGYHGGRSLPSQTFIRPKMMGHIGAFVNASMEFGQDSGSTNHSRSPCLPFPWRTSSIGSYPLGCVWRHPWKTFNI